jgi:hypothetical protein
MKKAKEEIKVYNCIDDFSHDFFGESSQKYNKKAEQLDDEEYGKILATDLLTELKERVK